MSVASNPVAFTAASPSARVLNAGRTTVALAFIETVRALRGKPGVTEIAFRDRWRAEMASTGELTINGWYSPPEYGMSVLFATGDNPSRTHFRTFRDTTSFPSERTCDWKDGIILAYASPVARATGVLADFATTVYFGRTKRIVEHFRLAATVCRDIIRTLPHCTVAGEAHAYALGLLAGSGLHGTTYSDTDPRGQNIGHTLPSLPPDTLGSELVTADFEQVRTARQFVRIGGAWPLKGAGQFTIEPQIIRPGESLPKVMLHYAVKLDPEPETPPPGAHVFSPALSVCDACELPLRQLELLA